MREGQRIYPGELASPEQLLALAEEYHRAVDTVRAGCPGKELPQFPYRLLAIQAVELYLQSSLEVELVDPRHWLTSCDAEALARGSNLAILGREVLQFANVEPLGNGRFRLSRLLRGGCGTEFAIAGHVPDEPFLLLEQHAVRTLKVPMWARGGTVNARALASPGATASVGVRARDSGVPIMIPTGGMMVDQEARAAITEMLRALERNGLVES